MKLLLLLPLFFSGAGEARTKKSNSLPPSESTPYRFTYDLGGAVGSYNGISYTELDLGLNWFFTDYLVWRNALFSRFGSEIDTIYGWDTSLRGVLSAGNSGLGMTMFAGPGFRTVSKGDNAPFLEGGLIFRLGGLSLGGGAKSLYYLNRDKNLPGQETIYFIILSGSGAF